MNKKDRIAIVVSVPYLIFAGFGFLEEASFGFVLLSPLFLYWGYRFIKGDISFLGSKFKED